MTEQSVQDLLAAWRAAERRLEEVTDWQTAEKLSAEVDRLREAYRRAIGAVRSEDVKPHGSGD